MSLEKIQARGALGLHAYAEFKRVESLTMRVLHYGLGLKVFGVWDFGLSGLTRIEARSMPTGFRITKFQLHW